MASGRQPATSTPEADNPSASLGNVLSSSLDMFKIEEVQTRKKAVVFLGNVSLATVNAYGKWLTAIKAVADACTATGYMFSQSDLCDFLAVAAKGMDSKRAGTKAVNDATFHIYMDVMENYPKSDEKLKLHFPRIVVDVISILDKGVDTRGEAVGVYGVERYYQERKITAPTEDPAASYIARPVQEIKQRTGQQAMPIALNDEFIENLSNMTGRSAKDLEASLTGLHPADVKKITDLCANYKRLQKYSKLTRPEALKKEVEKDLGRKLSDNQLQHALNSIRKARIYIENMLDGKFVPHGTHGINHVKHNLEYGYQLMGLIEPRKRKST